MSPSHRGHRPLLIFFCLVAAVLLLGAGLSIFMHESRPMPHAGRIEVIRPPHDVEALAFWNGTLVAGGRDGAFFIDTATDTLIGPVPLKNPPAFTQALLTDREGKLWIGHDTGIATWDGATAGDPGRAAGLPEGRILSLAQLRDGTVLAGTLHGLAARDGTGWKVTTTGDGLNNPVVNVLFEGPDGSLFIGSYDAPRGGISILDGGRFTTFGAGSGLPHPNVCAICTGENGSVFVGTGFYDRGGAAEFVRGPGGWVLSRTLGKGDGLAGEKVRSCFRDSAGRQWFGSEYDGVVWYDAAGWHRLTTADGLSHDEVKSIIEGPDGSVWLGTHDGVTRIRPEFWTAPLRAQVPGPDLPKGPPDQGTLTPGETRAGRPGTGGF